MKTVKPEKEYLRSLYRGNRLLWAVVMGLNVMIAAANLFVSWLLKETFDVISTQDPERLWYLAKIGILGLAATECLDILRYRLQALFLKRAVGQYRSFVFSRLARKSISAFSRENTGRYISVLTADVQTIEEKYLNASFRLVVAAVVGLGSCIMLFCYGGSLAWVCIGFGVIPIVGSLLMSGEMEKRTKAVSNQNEYFVAKIKDLLTGFAVLKSFKAEREAEILFDRTNWETEQIKLRRTWWDNLMLAMQEICSLILQLGVVFVGGFMAIQGTVSPGTAVVLINLCGQLVNPLTVLPQGVAAWRAARGLVVKMAEIGEENSTQTGLAIPPVLEEAITMENVTFGYEEDKPVLKNVSLRFEQGKKYAIVGASGSGKSTLLNLLMGCSSRYEGSIQVDGVELKDIDPDSLYDLISLIGQNVFLFDSTIRENITMFRDFPDSEVRSAAERSGLSAVMEAKGENYRCGENGQGLSGGERQRISIARALLHKCPVLMLDEATAALDNQTAFEVTDAILGLDGLTRIVVTHRLEEVLLKQYDKILVLRDGSIIEQGTYRCLMESTGYFYSLYHITN